MSTMAPGLCRLYVLTLNKVYLILTRTYYIISIGKNRKDAIETKKGTLQRSFFYALLLLAISIEPFTDKMANHTCYDRS